MARNRTIQYGIDQDTGLVCSHVLGEFAFPVLDFEGMKPENGFKAVYNLERLKHIQGARIVWTKKIPVDIKNRHRKYWNMKPLKETACPAK
jgi:hypothetical protein